MSLTGQLEDCLHPPTAEQRASELIDSISPCPGSFFSAGATTLLRAYLLAAAVSGADVDTIRFWVARPTDPAPLEALSHDPRPEVVECRRELDVYLRSDQAQLSGMLEVVREAIRV